MRASISPLRTSRIWNCFTWLGRSAGRKHAIFKISRRKWYAYAGFPMSAKLHSRLSVGVQNTILTMSLLTGNGEHSFSAGPTIWLVSA